MLYDLILFVGLYVFSLTVFSIIGEKVYDYAVFRVGKSKWLLLIIKLVVVIGGSLIFIAELRYIFLGIFK